MEVVVSGSPVKESEKKDSKPDDWQIRSWCETICEAEEIKADPEKMKYVKPELEKKSASMARAAKAITSTADLRKKAQELDDEGDDE